MPKPPRLARGAPAPSYIRWVHEDVLQMLGDAVSKALPKQSEKIEHPKQSISFELPSGLIKSIYTLISLQIVIAILLFILVIK